MRTDADILRDGALRVLEIWYSTWDKWGGSRSKILRRGALKAKALGLVGHDRILNGHLWSKR